MKRELLAQLQIQDVTRIASAAHYHVRVARIARRVCDESINVINGRSLFQHR